MNEKEYKHKRNMILSKFRSRKFRVLSGEENGMAFPMVDVGSILEWLETEKTKELLQLNRQYKGKLFDLSDDISFEKYERELRSVNGSTDLHSRRFRGRPKDKLGVYVDPRVCRVCGRVRCVCEDNEKSSDMEWLRMGKQ